MLRLGHLTSPRNLEGPIWEERLYHWSAVPEMPFANRVDRKIWCYDHRYSVRCNKSISMESAFYFFYNNNTILYNDLFICLIFKISTKKTCSSQISSRVLVSLSIAAVSEKATLEIFIPRRGAVCCFPSSNLTVVNGQVVISRTNRWIDGDYGGEVERRTKDGTR